MIHSSSTSTISVPVFAVLVVLAMVLLSACRVPGRIGIENMEPADGYDVGDINQRASFPFDPRNPPDHLFVSPTEELPYWWLVVRVGSWDGGAGASVRQVMIDGRAARDYFVIVNGEVHESPWVTKKAESAESVVVIIKTLWTDDASYDISVTTASAQTEAIHRVDLTAPSTGGGPAGFRLYDSFKLTESVGFDRLAEPVEITVAAERVDTDELADEVRLFRYDVDARRLIPLPFQVFDQRTFDGVPAVPEGEAPRTRSRFSAPSESIRLAFLAEVPANSARIYCVAYGGRSEDPPPTSPHTLTLTSAEDGGTIVETDHYRVDIAHPSGQINSFILKNADGVPGFTNSTSGAVHWNPDTYGDNGRWGHAFSWDPPEQTNVAANGPLLYRVTRSGRMPGYNPEIDLSVTYSFWAGVPYVRASSSMHVNRDFGASAIRNGEMVFDSELFDAFVWKEKSGQVRKIRARHRPDPLIDAPATPAADIPWLALYNTQGRYAIGTVALTAYAYDPIGGTPSVYRPAYFLYTHPFWGRPRNYFVRVWVYPFGYNDRMPAVPVRKGSTYVEDAVFFPFLLDDDDPFRPIENLDRTLRAPLEIRFGH